MSDGPATGLVPSDVDTRGVTFTWGPLTPGRTGSSKPPTTRPSTTKHLSVSTKSVSIKRARWTNPEFSLGRSCGSSHLAPGPRIPSGRRSVPRGGCTRSGSRHSGSCACRTGVDTSPRGPSSLPPTRPRSSRRTPPRPGSRGGGRSVRRSRRRRSSSWGRYGVVLSSRVQTLGIREVKMAPRAPWQNPYVERLIGTLRRECLKGQVADGRPAGAGHGQGSP